MLDEKDQYILCELLSHGQLTIREIKALIPFDDDRDCFRHLRLLSRWRWIAGSHYWHLTGKGVILAKLLAITPKNRKNYTRNLKGEVIFFEYDPHS